MLEYDEVAQQFEKNQKINFDLILQKLVKKWQAASNRPQILLHSCCAPCSTYTLEYLTKFADVTVYYANSNIHPQAEYERRKYYQQKFITDFNEQAHQNVHFISAPYQPSKWVATMKDLEKEPEGGARCRVCYDYRLEQVAEKAQELGFDYFGSALTISPHKNSQVINELGFEVQHIYDVAYLPSDFKKRGGYRRSVDMCNEYDIYRQCYCGCLFAARQQDLDLKQISREAKAFMQDHAHENFDKIAFHFTTVS